MSRALGLAVAVLALASCRQLFGIDDTEVARDAGSPDALLGGEVDADPSAPDADNTPDAPFDAPPDAPPDATPVCPAAYVMAFDGHHYRVSSNNLPWLLAESGCTADGANIHLVVPDDKAENQLLAALNIGDAWIGVTDMANEGQYVTVAGLTIPPAYENWIAGEPTGATDVNCVSARTSSGGNDGGWEVQACSLPRRHVCECPY